MSNVKVAKGSGLLIQLKRLRDGGAALSCTRRDGSIVWQRQGGSLGLVFPTHDLTHYAVETVLGYRRAFYGLLDSGWEFSDFAAPWPRGPVPDEARVAELIVSLFETERRMGLSWSADELREQAKLYIAAQTSRGKTAPLLPEVSNEQIGRIRRLLAELLARWAATRVEESLDLTFSL